MNSKRLDGALYENDYVETIKEIITGTAQRCADKPAYMYKDVSGEPFCSITYGEFKSHMDELGTALTDMGFKGGKISVAGENSHRWVMVYFATVCGVGTIVPLDKNLKIGEIVNLMNRAEIDIIFVSPKMADKVIEVFGKVGSLRKMVIMDSPFDDISRWEDYPEVTSLSELLQRGRELLDGGDRRYVDVSPEPGDLSAILFTSGTTGAAKGVMLSHMNLTQNVFNMSKYFNLPNDGELPARVLSVLPMHHAYEMTCTVMTGFYQGATIVICEGLKYLQKNFVEAGCATMLGVPLIFENIYKKIWKKAEKTGQAAALRRALAISKKLNLRNRPIVTRRMFKAVHSVFGSDIYCLIAGGAAIDPKVIVDFEAMGIPMIQGYGMTENAPIIAVNQDRYGKAASVGRPMPGTEVRVVGKDAAGIGEIICKGPSVMMGYYKDPENTAETIKDGWLYTGDYGYIDEDNFIYITGRKKNVIVTKGGKNIFPEEVEYYLLLSENVAEAMVYGKLDPARDDQICTAMIYPNFTILKEQGISEPRQIYAAIKKAVSEANAKMTPYKRVKRIEIRDEDFIKTTTLKIKRFEKSNFGYVYCDRDFEKRRY